MKPDRVRLFNEYTGFSKGEFDQNICDILLKEYYDEFEVLYKALVILHECGIYSDHTISPYVDEYNINIVIEDLFIEDVEPIFAEHKGFVYKVDLDTCSKRNTTIMTISQDITK